MTMKLWVIKERKTCLLEQQDSHLESSVKLDYLLTLLGWLEVKFPFAEKLMATQGASLNCYFR